MVGTKVEGSRQSLYGEVTARVIAELEEGRLPWVQPWERSRCGCTMPHNAGTGRAYSGVNIMILWSAVVAGGYASQRWLTFRQAQAAGGTVRKGEAGTTVCYADRFTPKAEAKRAGDEDREARTIAFLKRFTVCRAEIFLVEGSFEPTLEEETVDSRSPPVRQMIIKRESSRLNHPTWLVCDTHPKTPLWGEYCDLSLGVVNGGVSEKDEASLLVHKAEFAVSALSGPAMPEQGILGSLLRYLVTEHVGEIEQTNNYLYRLSPGSIQIGEDDA